jgi:hypothetical protein
MRNVKLKLLPNRKRKEEEAKQKALQASYEMSPAKPTGLKTMDEAANYIIQDAMEKNLQLYKKELSGEITPEEQVLKKKLMALPDTLDLMSKAYVDQNKNYIDGVKTGKIKRDLDYEKVLSGLGTSAKAFLDNEGNPVIGIDKDGDGKIDFMYNDYSGLNIKPNVVDNVDAEDSIKKVSDNLELNGQKQIATL